MKDFEAFVDGYSLMATKLACMSDLLEPEANLGLSGAFKAGKMVFGLNILANQAVLNAPVITPNHLITAGETSLVEAEIKEGVSAKEFLNARGFSPQTTAVNAIMMYPAGEYAFNAQLLIKNQDSYDSNQMNAAYGVHIFGKKHYNPLLNKRRLHSRDKL